MMRKKKVGPHHQRVRRPLTHEEHRGKLLLSYDDLRLFGIPYTRSHIWRRVKEGTFPAPVRIGDNRVAWRREAIIEFIENAA